jgi:TonB family protein
MRHSIGWVLCISCLLATVPAVAKDATVVAGYDEELRQATALLHQKQYKAAISALERLDQLTGGSCESCIILLSNAYTNAGERPEAAAAARRAIDLMRDPEPLLAYANGALAFSLLDPKARPSELAEAEKAIRRTLELDKSPALQHWGLGTLKWILFQRQHYDDMVVAGREYLENHPSGPDEDIARQLICVGRNLGNIPGPESPLPARRVGQAVQRPQPLYRPAPGYTQSAKDAGVEGILIVEAILDSEGCVVKTKIVKSLDPDLDQHVQDTVRYWAFQPATLEGQPVEVYYSLTVNFKMDSAAP